MTKFVTMGDPHLGRVFLNDVPLHRRGEREEMQRKEFLAQLVPPAGVAFHVCMGDLFDKTTVSLETILFAANSYRKIAEAHPAVRFIILRGNHDAGRDLQTVTAFDVFEKLVAPASNITCVTTSLLLPEADLAFFGWDPLIPAMTYIEAARGFTTVFGHWDTDLRIHPHNLVPTQELAALGAKTAYTGHVHKTDTFERHGVTVVGTGSLQPFAHGEQINEDLYVTLTLEELAEHDVTNKCVRVLLQPGERVEEIPNCLQFKTIMSKEDAAELPEVTVGEFDLASRFTTILTEHEVPEGISSQIKERWATL